MAETRAEFWAARSPRVGFGRFAARAGPDLVEALQDICRELDLKTAQVARELIARARSNDGRCDDGIVQQPRERNIGGLLAESAAQFFVSFQLLAILFEIFSALLVAREPTAL